MAIGNRIAKEDISVAAKLTIVKRDPDSGIVIDIPIKCNLDLAAGTTIRAAAAAHLKAQELAYDLEGWDYQFMINDAMVLGKLLYNGKEAGTDI